MATTKTPTVTARTPAESGSFKIIVVGAGIAGLAIAHGVERAKSEGKLQNLTVVIYEQRKEESSFQKYPIHVAPDGRSALQSLLAPETYQHLIKLSSHGISHGGIHLFNPSFSRLFGVRRYDNEQPQFVNRWVLKDVLGHGVRDVDESGRELPGSLQMDVRRGMRVVRAHQGDDKKVGVVFENGITEYADLVVGAEGLGSPLRAQLSPSHTRFPLLPFIVVSLKLSTPLSSLPLLPDKNGINMVLGSKNYDILLVPFHGTPLPPLPKTDTDTDLSPFYDPVSPSEPSPLKAVQDVLNTATPEYIFVNITLPSFSGWEDLTDSSWCITLVDLFRGDKAHPDIVRAFEEDIIPGTIGAWQIVSCDEKDPVSFKEGSRIVLVGDAAHAMPPQGGAGGSTALKDAEMLVNALISSSELGGAEGSLDRNLSAFHEEMTTRSHGLMIDAKRRLDLAHKSGIRVYTRWILLRLMDWVWPLANWVLNRNRESARKQLAESKKRV